VLGTGGTPQGHEWLTVHAALEGLGDEKVPANEIRYRLNPRSKARNVEVPDAGLKLVTATPVNVTQQTDVQAVIESGLAQPLPLSVSRNWTLTVTAGPPGIPLPTATLPQKGPRRNT